MSHTQDQEPCGETCAAFPVLRRSLHAFLSQYRTPRKSLTAVVESGDGFWVSVEEMVSVKHSEITRIWAELGDLHIDGMPEEAN